VCRHRTIPSRDILWISVNDIKILNVYRAPGTDEVVDYVISLAPHPGTIIGGDFNAYHHTFEPGVDNRYRGEEIAEWAATTGAAFIGEPGVATHAAGHVLDLTFSNIPFTRTVVRADLDNGSDHLPLITTIPGRGTPPPERQLYHVPDGNLERFAGLMRTAVMTLPDVQSIRSPKELDEYAATLTKLFDAAIEAAGHPPRQGQRGAPWWTVECARERHRWLKEDRTPEGRKRFQNTVRQAKRKYWTQIIDEVKDDKDLYRIVGWHKLEPRLKSPPLQTDGVTIEDPLEKAEALRRALLDRFDPSDDLEYDPLDPQHWHGCERIPWSTSLSEEETEHNTIRVSSTSPGKDQVTVRLLKACWQHVGPLIHGLYCKCLHLNHFPTVWKTAEVVMLPKGGKRDKSSPRSWRPIALLSVLGKGLERIIARRIALTALETGVLSHQHLGATPGRSAMDLVASLTHDVEAALSKNEEATMVTMDVLGAFDAVLRRRLLKRMADQGWPRSLLRLIDSFLTGRAACIRFENQWTNTHPIRCGTPQGSPLSPVLFMLYMAELLQKDTSHFFGYADDVCILRTSRSLEDNCTLLAADISKILEWGDSNKVAFAPEKLEAIHLTRKTHTRNPPIRVDNRVTIEPITATPGQAQAALRWLGVFFDRKLTWKRHVAERAAKARAVARHIKDLARTAHGPPANALRKATISCVLPSALYGTEAWYGGRTKPNKVPGKPEVSTRLGWHVETIDKTLATAARGVLPVYRTTRRATLFRDAGLPSGEVALEGAKLRFALRLQVADHKNPLVKRIQLPRIERGRRAGDYLVPKTKIQILGTLLPPIIRPLVTRPHYSPACLQDPTGKQDKETAAAAFKTWWAATTANEAIIFSDGSERILNGQRTVGYGYAIYRGTNLLTTGHAPICAEAHVFDAEAMGALKGLEKAIELAPRASHYSLCIDSTSVIRCCRGKAPITSNWVFLSLHELMEKHTVTVKWVPGHTGIEGNELADRLAQQATLPETPPPAQLTPEATPTASGLRTICKRLRQKTEESWWQKALPETSNWYRQWLTHGPRQYSTKTLPELHLPRATLHRWLAIRSAHGDFKAYHERFQHKDARLTCSCGCSKSPEHLVLCRRARRTFRQWPKRPPHPPVNKAEAVAYLKSLRPKDFSTLLEVTKFYERICPRGNPQERPDNQLNLTLQRNTTA